MDWLGAKKTQAKVYLKIKLFEFFDNFDITFLGLNA